MSKLLITSLVLLLNANLYSQVTKSRVYVEIPTNLAVVKIVKNPITDSIAVGSIVKREVERESELGKYTVTYWDTIVSGEEENYTYTKKENVEIKQLGGKANLVISEDKKTVNVNYWISKEETIEAHRNYKILTRNIRKDSEFDLKMFDNIQCHKLKCDSNVRLTKVYLTNMDYDWIDKSDLIIAIYTDDCNTIDYLLVNKWDRDGEYELKMENRKLLSIWERSFVFGGTTIPLKYRKGYNVGDSIFVKDDFSANANLGVFLGYKLSKYRTRYELDKFVELPEWGLVAGPFVSLSSVELDSLSTTAGRVPFEKEQKSKIGVLSTGLGIMLSYNNISLGGFIGWDFGFGSDAKNWNYNNKPWFGIGISYSPYFWKKE